MIGTTKVKAGNLVGRGESTLLVTISQIDPILFRAGIAEAEYLKVARRFMEERAQGAVQGEKTPIQLILADGTVHPHEGRLDAIERNVDTLTGTIALQIKFDNPERIVRPGQFGRVRFVIEQKKDALLVPQRAVQELQNLYNLAVVGADNTVSFRTVKVGPREGTLWVIEDGLKPGERVVVEGLQRLREGATVNPKPVPADAAPEAPRRRGGEVAMARFFINRPIVAMVISIVTVLLGVVAMSGLPIAQYPEIVPPMVQVTTTFVGASATDVEAAVATPIEQKVNGVENSIYMKSTNANDGTLTLKVSFDVGSNLDMANVLTQNKLSEAMPQLPASVKTYGVAVKKALAFPLLVLSIKSPNGTYDNNFLSNYTTINIQDNLARIKGVGQINLFGGSDYAMRVWLRPDRIARLGITVPDIVNAISQQNTLSPSGQFGGQPAVPGTEFTYTVRTQGRLLDEAEFGEIIVRSNPDGSQVRLKDVARIELGTQLYNAVGRHDAKPAAVLAVFQIPGTNALAVAKEIKATMEELSKRFPRDLEYKVSLDTTLPVEEGINEIVHTLLEAVVLVIIVVFVFLQNWRATLIPLMTVPVSLVGAFIFFPLLGFSINVLSLLGLVLAIGIVVDDAIVVVEAVMHHLEHGMSPKEATYKAMEEVSGPVVAIALILAAVFIPVGFMGGISGMLYQQFAITIAISVLLSAFNALTLSPALSALLLKPPTGKKTLLTPFYRGFNKAFGAGTNAYLGVAGFLVRKLVVSIVLIGGLVFLTIGFVNRIPGGFLPEEDQGYILVNAMLPDASSLQRTDVVMRKVEQDPRRERGRGRL